MNMKNYSRFSLLILTVFYAFSSTGSLQAAEGAVDVKDFAPAVLSLDQAKDLKNQFVFWLGKHYRCLYGGKCTRAEKKEVMAEWKRWGKLLGAGVVVALGAYFAPKGAKAVRSAIRGVVDEEATRVADRLNREIDATLGIADLRLPPVVEAGIRRRVMDDGSILLKDKDQAIASDIQNALIELRIQRREEAIAALTGVAAGGAVAGAVGQAEVNRARLAALSSTIVSAGVNAVLVSIDQGALAKDGDGKDAVLTAAQRRERVQELTQQALRTILQIPAEQEIGEEGLAGTIVEQVLRQLETREVQVPWMGPVGVTRRSREQGAAAAAAGAAPAQPGQPGYQGAGASPAWQNPMSEMSPAMQQAGGSGRLGGQSTSTLRPFRGDTGGFGGRWYRQ